VTYDVHLYDSLAAFNNILTGLFPIRQGRPTHYALAMEVSKYLLSISVLLLSQNGQNLLTGHNLRSPELCDETNMEQKVMQI
jgi:hypothetical protein